MSVWIGKRPSRETRPNGSRGVTRVVDSSTTISCARILPGSAFLVGLETRFCYNTLGWDIRTRFRQPTWLFLFNRVAAFCKVGVGVFTQCGTEHSLSGRRKCQRLMLLPRGEFIDLFCFVSARQNLHKEVQPNGDFICSHVDSETHERC